MKGYEIRRLSSETADAGAAIFIDGTDFRSHRPQLKGDVLARNDGENIGIVHEIIRATAAHEGVAESDHAISIHIRDRAHSAQFQIPGHQRGSHSAAGFQRPRRLIGRYRRRCHRRHMKILHLAGKKSQSLTAIAASHERRIQGDQIIRQAWREAGISLIIHGPQLQHIGNRRHHTDTTAGLWKAIGHSAKKLSINVYRTAAHTLGNAFGFIDQRARYLYQHQIAPGGPLLLHDAKDFHVKGFDVCAMHHGLRVSVHALFHL